MNVCGVDIGYGDRVRVSVNYVSPITGTDSIAGPVVDFDVDDEGNETVDVGQGGFNLVVLVRDITKVERVG